MIVLAAFGTLVLAGVLAWFAQGWLAAGLRRYRTVFTDAAQSRLGEFFLFVDPAQLWVANLLLCAATLVAVYAATGLPWAGAAAAALAAAAPRWAIGRMRRNRRRRFDEQLPDLLLSLAGALRAGSGLQAALRHIVAQSPAPLSQEFGLMLREQRMGLGFEQALAQLYRRMPSEGVGLVAASLNVAAHSGGNLAETLERIAATLRARQHLLGRVRALTSQGRLQAWVMACLPILLAGVLDRLDPEAMALLWRHPAGWAVLAVIAVLETAGILFIRRIVDIQV